MDKKKKALSTGVLALAVAVGAFAYFGCTPSTGSAGQPQGSGKSYLLRVKEKPGSKWSYKYKVKTFVDPKNLTAAKKVELGVPDYGSAEIDGVINLEVKSVKDGKTTFLKTGTKTAMKGTGIWKAQAAEPIKPDPPSSYIWDEMMTNVTLTDGDYKDPLTNSFHKLLPKDPVKVGSSWEYKPFPDNPAMATAKVVGEEKMHGRNTLKLMLTLPGVPGDKNTMTLWLDTETSRYIKVDMLTVSNFEGLVSENHLVQEIVD